MKLYTLPTCMPCRSVKRAIGDEELTGVVEIVDDPSLFPGHVRGVPTLDTDDHGPLVGADGIIKHLKEYKEKN